MTKGIHISTDSTCDLPPQLASEYGIDLVPLYVNMGDKTYRDGVDISPADIYSFVEMTGKLPTTSACTVEDYKRIFDQARENGQEAIHVNISSHMSASHQNALIAAQGRQDVIIIDSGNLSTGIAHLVLEAVAMACEGKNGQYIGERLMAIVPKIRSSFVVEKLDYLHRGGRCTSLELLGANVLNLKPSIVVNEGILVVGEKYRGSLAKVLDQYVEHQLQGRADLVLDRIFITHSGCRVDLVKQVENDIRRLQPFKEIIETRAGCVISSHCGPNTLGILFKTT
jgi:DegV family protein with EDD domain